MSEPDPPMDPIEALRLIKLLIDVAAAADNLGASNLILREIRNVVVKALPKRPRHGRRKA